jgi:hypothetical protein
MKPGKAAVRNGNIGQLNSAAASLPGSDSPWLRKYGKHGWYVPNDNPYPLAQARFEGDLATLVREAVLPGHLPATPLFQEKDVIITLGSCFARELRLFLSEAGIGSSGFWVPSGLNNTFALLDFFSWCVTGEETGRGYRYERDGSGTIEEWKPARERQAYVDAFARAGGFVFTIGLAEVWEDRDTGRVFWRGVPADIFNEERHVFRLTTVDENAENLRRLVQVIRQINSTAPVILTLSPVPLLASFRDISCLTADCVSKSVLRVAIDQVMSDRLASIFYWPSFEIVRWVGGNLPYPAFGEDGKARDVNRRVVAAIIEAFIESYYPPAVRDRMRARQLLDSRATSAESGID